MSKVRVLIVEDEVFTADQEEKRLLDMGYDVVGKADSGEDAVQLAHESRPDLVLMDIRLHGRMDGIDAADEIKTKLNIPVIYVTAYADDDLLQRARVTEAFGYILKPFDDKELKTNIEIALYKNKVEKEMEKSLDESERLNKILLQREFRIRELSDQVKKLKAEAEKNRQA